MATKRASDEQPSDPTAGARSASASHGHGDDRDGGPAGHPEHGEAVWRAESERVVTAAVPPDADEPLGPPTQRVRDVEDRPAHATTGGRTTDPTTNADDGRDPAVR